MNNNSKPSSHHWSSSSESSLARSSAEEEAGRQERQQQEEERQRRGHHAMVSGAGFPSSSMTSAAEAPSQQSQQPPRTFLQATTVRGGGTDHATSLFGNGGSIGGGSIAPAFAPVASFGLSSPVAGMEYQIVFDVSGNHHLEPRFSEHDVGAATNNDGRSSVRGAGASIISSLPVATEDHAARSTTIARPQNGGQYQQPYQDHMNQENHSSVLSSSILSGGAEFANDRGNSRVLLLDVIDNVLEIVLDGDDEDQLEEVATPGGIGPTYFHSSFQ